MSDLRAQRDVLWHRCRGYCEKCGWPLPTLWAAHHRKLRKHGGTDEVTNLLALHHNCHNVAPGSVHQEPMASYGNGFLVPAHIVNPQLVPVLLHGNKWVLLEPDGTYRHLTEEQAHAAQLDAC